MHKVYPSLYFIVELAASKVWGRQSLNQQFKHWLCLLSLDWDNFNYFSLAIERGLQCTTNAIFVSHMQKLWVLKVLLVHDPKPPGEPDINDVGILKIKSVLIVVHFEVLILGGLMV